MLSIARRGARLHDDTRGAGPLPGARWRRAGAAVAVWCALAAAAERAAPAPARGAPAEGRGAPAEARGDRGPAPAASLADPGEELMAFLRLAAVTGREEPAAAFIRERLGRRLPVRSDAGGNLTVTLGSGQPRRLVVCPLGEPGFVVSRIEADGYLRLAAIGDAIPATGALWTQAHEGQVVWVAGARGAVPGVVAARSIHLLRRRGRPAPTPAPPFSTADAFVGVGAETAAEVAALGIRPLDPVAADRRPERLAGDLVAGPSARVKAACLAAADAARRWHPAPGHGTTVFAWTARDLMQRAGLDRLLRERGPFSELVVLGWGFGWEEQAGGARPVPLPAPGTGLLAAGALAGRIPGARAVPYLAARLRPDETPLYPARIGYLGLPARYPNSLVETVALGDMRQLAAAMLSLLGRGAATGRGRPAPLPLPLPPPGGGSVAADRAALPARAAGAAGGDAAGSRHAETAALIAALVGQYGVSGDEARVREAVAARLPSWARPVVEWPGNLSVTVGPPSDPEPLLFMAHLDEIGYRVSEVLADGRLKLQARGGLLNSYWEGQAALVHGRRGPVAAVFEPRPDWLTAARRRPPAGGLTAFLGAGGPGEVAALGIQPGTAVTMPKALLRLGRDRVAARSLDDRGGAAVLLLALRRLDRARLRHAVTFAWTAREEVGFWGAAALANRLGGRRRVYPVDALPTSDSPRESRQTAYLPLGHGAVLPAAAPRAALARLLDLGRRRGIALQVGAVFGGNDGVPFQAGDSTVLPLSWPCRYIHSPGEVSDLRDLEALVDLVVAVAGGP